jgi:hypothetical protein
MFDPSSLIAEMQAFVPSVVAFALMLGVVAVTIAIIWFVVALFVRRST